MKRRNFLRNTMFAGTAAIMSAPAKAATANARFQAEKPFNMLFATHEGMFEQSAGKNFIDQIQFAYDMGIRAIEDNEMMSRPVEEQKKIGNKLASLGMSMGVFVVTSDSWHWKTSLTTGKKEFLDRMVADMKTAVEVAKRCNAKFVTVVPGNYERSLSYDLQLANVIDALKRGSEILESAGLTMVLEPLSDNPDLFLRHSDQTYMICRAVNSPSCKILFDLYHMQRNEGNIIANIDKVWTEIGYFQIGDNPGRNEPTTGEMNYGNIFKHIHDKGYKGVLGMEHGKSKPGKEGELALLKAYREVDLA